MLRLHCQLLLSTRNSLESANPVVEYPRNFARRRHKEGFIAKVLRCRDLGLNCPREIRADTEDELLRLAGEHAEKDHGISASNIPPSILAMVKAAIKDEV